MPRPQTPLAKANLTGAAAHNPKRFRERTEPLSTGKPVGSAPAYLDRDAKAVWKEMAENLGWLQAEDRTALEAAAATIGQMRKIYKSGELVPASLLSAVNTAIGKLGASPTDRGKVFQAPPPEEDDEWGDFDGKPN